MELTQSILKSILCYNGKTGIFIWDKPFSNRMKQGQIAGSINKSLRYNCISILGINYYAHRLAWLYMTGKWPNNQIDHIDGNRSNNSWHNLRDVSLNENRKNQRIRKTSTTKIHGVNWMKSKSKWRARIATTHLLLKSWALTYPI